MTKKKIENLKRISNKDIESIIQNLSTRKSMGPDAFAGEYYLIVKKE